MSKESAQRVRDVITQESPDCVCVELDAQRYAALSQQRRLEDLDLKQVIRQRQLSPLIAGLILSAYQKKLGGELGVMPGTELLEAVNVAQHHHIPIVLCDRDIKITLARAWRTTPWHKKLLLLASLLQGMFERQTISEETLRELRQQDVLSVMLDEFSESLPTLRQVLIDERDVYMTDKIRQADGDRVVAIVGAAHVPGIRRLLAQQPTPMPSHLTTIPPASAVWKWMQWVIPATIIGALVFIGWQQGAAAAGDNARFWFFANGIPSALGAVAAFAHPVTVVVAFLASLPMATPSMPPSSRTSRIKRCGGIPQLSGICTARQPPGASRRIRRRNSFSCPSSHCRAAFEKIRSGGSAGCQFCTSACNQSMEKVQAQLLPAFQPSYRGHKQGRWATARRSDA